MDVRFGLATAVEKPVSQFHNRFMNAKATARCLGTLLAVALGAVSACGTGHSGGTSSGASGLVGTWRPMTILGHDVSSLGTSPETRADVSFRAGGAWAASDGCDVSTGSYRVPAPGRIVAVELATTIALCPSPIVANNTAISLAKRYSLKDGLLTFMRIDGTVIATYMRES